MGNRVGLEELRDFLSPDHGSLTWLLRPGGALSHPSIGTSQATEEQGGHSSAEPKFESGALPLPSLVASHTFDSCGGCLSLCGD